MQTITHNRMKKSRPRSVDTSERDFEAGIEQALLEPQRIVTGYTLRELDAASKSGVYRKRLPENFDRSLCLDTDILFEFLKVTQPNTFDKLAKQHGKEVKEKFLQRLVSEIETRGTLDVLRKGVADLGCKFDLVYFKPDSTLNPEHARLYAANIPSLIRQLKYSTRNENSIDIVLFINGIPLITIELKNPAKGQRVQDAVRQYRQDRDPSEPLLKFGRCIAHFAVDTDRSVPKFEFC